MARRPQGGFGKLLARRKGFLAKVYGLLALELAICALVTRAVRNDAQLGATVRRWRLWLIVAAFAIVLALAFLPLPAPARLALFTALVVVMGCINVAAVRPGVTASAIEAGVVGTTGLFVVATAVAFGLAAAGVDLGFMGFALLMALLGLVVASVLVLVFLRTAVVAIKAILVVGIALFAVYIAFDTNVMLMDPAPRVVDSAINLFFDAYNVFSKITALESL